ncbi:MAG TPA: serine hydrolase domain-containing protein [Acidimicrobiia bacterium]
MGSTRRSSFRIALVASLAIASLVVVVPASGAATSKADAALQRALDAFVKRSDGPHGISVVVQSGADPVQLTAGVADVATEQAWGVTDEMRMASVAKAFSGAAAVSAVADGKLTLDSTVGEILPSQSATWAKITLAQLLQHTSGIPDFSKNPAFGEAVGASLTVPPPPDQLPTYAADQPLLFPPGTKYAYSNTDNILVGLMVAAVDGTSYEQSLMTRVYQPLSLAGTSLPVGPELTTPFTHGYAPDPPNADEDVSVVLAAGWSWASGGVVSTPQDANQFVRGYASGKLTNAATQKLQFTFRPGKSEPTGPGTNSAGLGIFRYQTSCGTVYGHTGNTLGYTQFIASTKDGARSTVVSINSQLTPDRNPKIFPALRKIYGLAVCAALKG